MAIIGLEYLIHDEKVRPLNVVIDEYERFKNNSRELIERYRTALYNLIAENSKLKEENRLLKEKINLKGRKF